MSYLIPFDKALSVITSKRGFKVRAGSHRANGAKELAVHIASKKKKTGIFGFLPGLGLKAVTMS